jgi:hypothetical protein
VEKIVDKCRYPVDRLWINTELSTARGYPQFFPQVYPQIRPLLSTGLSTAHAPTAGGVIHNTSELSTEVVDNLANLWMDPAPFIHISAPACGWSVDKIRVKCFFGVTKYLPWGEGVRGVMRVNVCF